VAGDVARERLTYDAYVSDESARSLKHEYLDGVVRAMAGGSPRHGQLASAFLRLAGNALEGRSCATYSSDVRVYVAAANRGYYPDGSVVSGKLERAPNDQMAITNPVVIVEVLSDRTEAIDRGERWRHYRQLASLREYVLVSQDEPLVEVHRRDGASWSFHEFGSGSQIELASIGASISVDELYRDPLASSSA